MDSKTILAGSWRSLAMTAVAAASMLVGPITNAADQSFTYRYTGYGFDTATDVYPAGEPDGFPVNITNAVGKGSGVALVAITAEFAPDLLGSVNCPDGYTVPFFLVYSSNVVTFADRSQTTGFSDNGWLCLTADLTAYVGAVEGFITGGTGRFAGATGEFESTFDGMNIDPFFGFRTIRGESRTTLWTK
jgi:hypothetical protein